MSDNACELSDHSAEDCPPSRSAVCVASREQQSAENSHESALVEKRSQRRTSSNGRIEFGLRRVLPGSVYQPNNSTKEREDDPPKGCPPPVGRCMLVASASLFALSRHANTKLTKELFPSVPVRVAQTVRAVTHPRPHSSHSFWHSPASACKLAMISEGKPCLSRTPLAITAIRSASATVCRR